MRRLHLRWSERGEAIYPIKHERTPDRLTSTSAATNSPSSRSFFRAWQPRAKQGQTNELAYSCC